MLEPTDAEPTAFVSALGHEILRLKKKKKRKKEKKGFAHLAGGEQTLLVAEALRSQRRRYWCSEPL